jgi:hypothetical protein
MKTLLALLKSRKFLAAAGAVVVILGVALKGWNEETSMALAERIINAVLVLAGLFIGGTAIEDAAAKLRGGSGTNTNP